MTNTVITINIFIMCEFIWILFFVRILFLLNRFSLSNLFTSMYPSIFLGIFLIKKHLFAIKLDSRPMNNKKTDLV